MKQSTRPLVTTLIGGLIFLLPLVVVLVVVGQGLALMTRVVQPLVSWLPYQTLGRALSDRFDTRLQTIYPRYAVIKAMSQGLHGALGQRVMKAVLVSFDDHQAIAFDMERLDDGRAVLYLPGAPDAWSGSVVLVPSERVAPLDVDTAALTRSLQRLGLGTAALLRAAPATVAARPASPGASS